MLQDFSSILTLLGNFGFPIVISMYLLLKLETRMKGLEDAIIQLKDLLFTWRDD